MSNKTNRIKRKVRSWNRQDYIVLACAVLGIAVVSAAAVFVVRAFLTDYTALRSNVFSSMTYTNIEIVEPTKDYDVELSFNDVSEKYESKDGTLTKDAQIKNLSGGDKKPVYVRMKIIMTISDENGIDITSNYSFASFRVQLDESSLLDVPDDWQFVDDELTDEELGGGYYYYKHILLPGDSTSDLFKSDNVKITNAVFLPDNAIVHIDILADAVQAVSTDSTKWTAADYYSEASIQEVQTAWGMTPSVKSADPATQDNTKQEARDINSWLKTT